MFDLTISFENIKIQILKTSSLFQTESLDCIKYKYARATCASQMR